MAYASRRFIRHIDDYDRVHRLEIQQLDYIGSESAIKANKGSGAFSFEHEDVTDEDGYLKVYANPIQKGMLEVYPLIENSTDFALLTDIFQSDEDEFRLVWKIDGSIFWTGSVLNDLLEFEESSYPYTSTIVAKDFSRLKGMDYPLTDTRQTWITTIADLLSYLNLGINIDTATTWTESHLDSSLTGDYDYLNHIYHETKALREFGRTGDESPQPISVYEALQRVLSDNCLILKQIDGKYQIDQLSAYSDPANVLVSTYDSTGTQTAQTTVDKTLTYNRNTMRVKTQGSKSKGFVAIKRAKVKFDHRNRISGLLFSDNIVLTGNDSHNESGSFISDANQKLRLTGEVEAFSKEPPETPDFATAATAEIVIVIERSGLSNYWWDGSSWVTSFASVTVDLGNPGGNRWLASFELFTDETPADADGLLSITLHNVETDQDPTGAGNIPDETSYYDTSLEITNINNSVSTDFQLTQSAGFSEKYEHDKTWYGDGPNSFSVSAIRYSTADGDITNDSWQRRGTTTDYRDYHENVLKEIVDIQRTFVFRKEAAMWGLYDATKVLLYRSGNYYYAGGSFAGATGDWNVRIMDVNIQTGSDTFEEILKYSDGEGSAPAPPSDGGGGGTGGISKSEADGRYFKQASLLGEIATSDIDTALTNLGLKDGSRDLDFNSLNINGNPFVDSTRHITATSALISDNEAGVVLGTDTRSPRLASARDSAPGALTVQPGGGSHSGSIEVYPSGTSERSHFLATNAPDPDNFGFVEFEVNQLDAWLHAANKGTGTAPTSFRFYNFPDGVRFDAAVSVNAKFVVGKPALEFAQTAEFQGNDGALDEIGRIADFSYFPSGTALNGIGAQIHIGTKNDADNYRAGRIEYRLSDVTALNETGVFAFGTHDSGSFAERFEIRGAESRFYDALQVDGPATFADSSVAWTTPTFNTGFLGNGSRLYQEASEYHFETDVGFFRSALFANEFIINQILATQGSRIAGPGRGKVETVVSGTSGSEVVEVSDPEGNQYAAFAVDDLLLCLQVRNDLDIGTTNVLTDSGGVIVKRYVRRVTDVTGNQVTFTTPGDAPSDAGSVAQGDVIVAFGNATDSSRASLLYETVIEPNSPYTVVKTSINSWTNYKNPNTLRMKYGNLNQSYGYTTDTFGMAVGPPSGDHATFDSPNGVRFIDGSGNVGAQFNSSLFTMGTPGTNFVEFDIAAGTGNMRFEEFALSTPDLRINSTGPTILAYDSSTEDRVYMGRTYSPALSQYGSVGINMINSTAGVEYFRLDSADRHIAHWDIDEHRIMASNGDNNFQLFSEASSGAPSMRIYNTTSRAMVTVGRGYWTSGGVTGWKDEFGFALMGDYANEEPYIQFTRNITSGDLTARLASSYFDATGQWGGDPSKANASILFDYANSDIIVGSGGSITNNAGDYSITDQGYSVSTQSSYSDPKSYKVKDGASTVGALWGSSSRIQLDAMGSILDLTSIGGRVQLTGASNFVRVVDAGDITIETSTGDLNVTGASGRNMNVGIYLKCDNRFRLPNYTNTTRPSSPTTGELIFNTSSNEVQVGTNGGTWATV